MLLLQLSPAGKKRTIYLSQFKTISYLKDRQKTSTTSFIIFCRLLTIQCSWSCSSSPQSPFQITPTEFPPLHIPSTSLTLLLLMPFSLPPSPSSSRCPISQPTSSEIPVCPPLFFFLHQSFFYSNCHLPLS